MTEKKKAKTLDPALGRMYGIEDLVKDWARRETSDKEFLVNILEELAQLKRDLDVYLG
jgi:hypothetical protein